MNVSQKPTLSGICDSICKGKDCQRGKQDNGIHPEYPPELSLMPDRATQTHQNHRLRYGYSSYPPDFTISQPCRWLQLLFFLAFSSESRSDVLTASQPRSGDLTTPPNHKKGSRMAAFQIRFRQTTRCASPLISPTYREDCSGDIRGVIGGEKEDRAGLLIGGAITAHHC